MIDFIMSWHMNLKIKHQISVTESYSKFVLLSRLQRQRTLNNGELSGPLNKLPIDGSQRRAMWRKSKVNSSVTC